MQFKLVVNVERLKADATKQINLLTEKKINAMIPPWRQTLLLAKLSKATKGKGQQTSVSLESLELLETLHDNAIAALDTFTESKQFSEAVTQYKQLLDTVNED